MKTIALAAALAVLGYAIPAHASDATAERSLARRATAVSTAPVATEQALDPCASCCMRTKAEKSDGLMHHVPGHK